MDLLTLTDSFILYLLINSPFFHLHLTLLSPSYSKECANLNELPRISVLPAHFVQNKDRILFRKKQNMAQSHGVIYSSCRSPQHIEHKKQSHVHLPLLKLKFPHKRSLHRFGKSSNHLPHRSSLACQSTDTQNTETKECVIQYNDCSDLPRVQGEDKRSVLPVRVNNSSQGLAEACRFVYNDAKYVNERAQNDIVLLSRGIKRLDARARQDVAILGSGFLKLDARAREDTEKIDNDVKKRAEGLHHIAIILKNKAESRLKKASYKHWSDGALEADLRRADLLAKQRAMEDALMALEFMKNIHDMMVSKMYKFPLHSDKGSLSANDMAERITLEKNGTTLDIFPWDVSTDRITAIQEAYWDIASALSEGDRIDYTDPEELELLVATLIDLDAMDGKRSVSLLAECSSSPDVNIRKALAKALSAAPSMWTLGNAGMGALQRLAEDSNPAIAAAATKTINELKRQWKIEEGDSWRFMMNQNQVVDFDDDVED